MLHHALDDAAGGSGTARGSEECVRLLMRHREGVRAFLATLLPNPDDAEEVLQEASVVAWRKFGQFAPGTNFFNWMCGIAKLEALRFRRHHQQGRLLFDEALMAGIAGDQLEQPDLWDNRREALLGCIAKLRETDRDLLRACYLNQSTVKGAAQKVGRPINTVYKALNRIRERLFQCIERAVAREGTP
jgi:RNA polymerase sigma-70 factor, ECF subfamily